MCTICCTSVLTRICMPQYNKSILNHGTVNYSTLVLLLRRTLSEVLNSSYLAVAYYLHLETVHRRSSMKACRRARSHMPSSCFPPLTRLQCAGFCFLALGTPASHKPESKRKKTNRHSTLGERELRRWEATISKAGMAASIT